MERLQARSSRPRTSCRRRPRTLPAFTLSTSSPTTVSTAASICDVGAHPSPWHSTQWLRGASSFATPLPYQCCRPNHPSACRTPPIAVQRSNHSRHTSGNAATEPLPSGPRKAAEQRRSPHRNRGNGASMRRSDKLAAAVQGGPAVNRGALGKLSGKSTSASYGHDGEGEAWGRRREPQRESKQYGRGVELGSANVLMNGSEALKRDFLAALRRGEEHMSIAQCNEILANLCRNRRIRDALALVHIWEQKPFLDLLTVSKSVKTYTIMLDVYGKSHQLARAFSLFYGMCRAGVQPNIITYNAMIAACARNNEPDLAYEVFEEMQANGLKPDKFTYGSLIDSCAKSGQVERAFQISELMDKNHVTKDPTIYSALMDACGRAKQLERAFLVFEEMKRNGVWPNLITFSVLIDTCANAREPERAFQLFSEIKHWGFARANVVVYTSLIDACSKAGWPERAELVLRSMIENGVEPNEISFGALMDGWTKEGHIDRAFGILDRMVNEHQVLPNAVLLGGLTDACRRLGEYSRAKAIWGVVMTHNIRPSRTYYPALISMAARNGDFDVASAIAFHAYARGSLRRVALNSENPTLHALACAIAYLKHAIENDAACTDEAKKQHLDRLRVVFSSTAMTTDQMNSISAEEAFQVCLSWNQADSKEQQSAADKGDLFRYRNGAFRRDGLRSAAARRSKDVAARSSARYRRRNGQAASPP